MERKGCESIIHAHDGDLCVTMVGWVAYDYSIPVDLNVACMRSHETGIYCWYLTVAFSAAIHYSKNEWLIIDMIFRNKLW